MMIRLIFLVCAMTCLSSNLHAQHNDIEFGYDNPSNPTDFLLSPLAFEEATVDGIILVKSDMEALDPFTPNDFAADQPGFATFRLNDPPLLVNPDDWIGIKVLDASVDSAFGVGYVNFYNPALDALEATGRIEVEDNMSSTPHLVLNGDSIESGENLQFIEFADNDGDVHDHIKFDLLDDSIAPTGAYGILVQLQSDFAPVDGKIDLCSQPFWLVFNRGMSEKDFESLALQKFGVFAFVLGDANDDGVFNNFDVAGFVAALTGS